MTKNPFINAGAALGYIGLVVLVLTSFVDGPKEQMPQFELLIPLAMISLFVLSAAVMGYVFLYQPVVLFLAGEQGRGVALFLQTLGVFGAVVVCLLGLVVFLG